jgi:endonuclease III
VRLRGHSLSSRRRRAAAASRVLHEAFGSPRHGNPGDPLEDLVFVVLSQMTTWQSSGRAYERLRSHASTWQDVVALGEDRLAELLGGAGLSHQKARHLLGMLCRVRDDFGDFDLRALAKLPPREAERYLLSLPGVGLKTAKCVQLYALGEQVLPVDTHVHRVASRLGLLPKRSIPSTSHATLERVVPRRDRYSFHVNAIALGRQVCRPVRPRCPGCPVAALCPSNTS